MILETEMAKNITNIHECTKIHECKKTSHFFFALYGYMKVLFFRKNFMFENVLTIPIWYNWCVGQ